MARLFDLSDATFSGVNGITAGPLTMACWARPNDVTSVTQRFMDITNSGDANAFMRLVFVDSGDFLRFSVRQDGNGQQSATTTATMSQDTWHHCAGMWTSATDKTAWLDGVSSTANTTSRAPTGLDQGALFDNFKGDGAHASIWNVALSQEEMTALAAGAHPFTIRPSALRLYWPLYGDTDPDPELISGAEATLVGSSSKSEDPGLMGPRQALFVPGAAAAASGRIMGSLAANGGLAGTGGIAGIGGGIAG